MSDLFAIQRAALISSGGLYRYTLSRIWDANLPLLVFIMLNPSTADGEKDDPTIRKCIGFAQRWGFGGFIVVNLYAYRATKPQSMWAAERSGINIIGPDNDDHILEACVQAKMVLLAYGAHEKARERGEDVGRMLHSQNIGYRVHTLGLTDAGQPRHPLFVPYKVQPQLWRRAA